MNTFIILVKEMNYLNIPIRMRKHENTIVIEYDEQLQTVARNPLDANIVFACFKTLTNKYEYKSYWNFLGSQYKREYEILTKEMFDEFEKKFFKEMDESLEKVLGLVFEVMETPLAKYLTYSNSEAFNLLKYFAEFGEIPDLNDFYALKMTNYYAGIKEYRFQNIKRDIRYTIYDYTEGQFKRHKNMKNKFVVKIDENKKFDKIIKRCETYDEAFNLIKSKIKFVKGV